MSLELIIGPMFAGKSTAALQRIRRAEVLGRKIFVVSSIIDTRYDSGGCALKTHNNDGMAAVGVKELTEVFYLTSYHDAQLIVIEEAQFFKELYDPVKRMVEVDKKSVIVVGLDGDSERKPFGQILDLIPITDTITKLTALCKRCPRETPGLFSALMGEKNEQICVGGVGKYEALCREHYIGRKLVKTTSIRPASITSRNF